MWKEQRGLTNLEFYQVCELFWFYHIVTLCGLYVFNTKQVVQPVLDSSFKNSLQDNGESTHFDADTFDIVQYSYVLHEMPMENAHALLSEAYRILKPGGVLSGFEGM